jgi:hypothetical protein
VAALDTHGSGGSVTLRFLAYEELPDTNPNAALLSLTDQHPTATVDTDAADYRAALNRLFPKG